MNSSAPHAEPVVVTGLGAFTAAGAGTSVLWESVLQGISPARWYEATKPGGPRLPVCVAPDPKSDDPRLRRLRRSDRIVQLAGAAACEAWDDAGLQKSGPPPERIAIFAGTSRGPVGSILHSAAGYAAEERLSPTIALNTTVACLSGALSLLFAVRGPCLTISAACASGGAAIAMAAQQVSAGLVDVALAGGAEAPFHDFVLAQLQNARVLAHHSEPHLACRPFDAARSGTVLGEGAAFLVLESLSSARRRGARIHAQLGGWAVGAEGNERTGISAHNQSLHQQITHALAMASVPEIAHLYVNAHATGTDLGDRMEAEVINRISARNRNNVTSSTKAVTGHCMGAAAAIEAVISVLALERQCLPPSANCFEQANDCALTLVRERPTSCRVDAVLSNSAGFWGNNAALVFTPSPTN
ncbi:MAG: beta-ketoacyl-[acyl-carrier-protein] synthase family protein [Chthoniobacterales bacterium]